MCRTCRMLAAPGLYAGHISWLAFWNQVACFRDFAPRTTAIVHVVVGASSLAKICRRPFEKPATAFIAPKHHVLIGKYKPIGFRVFNSNHKEGDLLLLSDDLLDQVRSLAQLHIGGKCAQSLFAETCVVYIRNPKERLRVFFDIFIEPWHRQR